MSHVHGDVSRVLLISPSNLTSSYSIVQHNIVLISKAEYLKNKLQKTHSLAEL